MPSLTASIAGYEARLAARFGPALDQQALALKHDRMRESSFLFLRATCWRWAEVVPERWPGLMTAPAVGSVGDAHVGNFGLWRDAQFRPVWGVNDYDEAALLPFTLDLVRLCASIALADPEGDAADAAEQALDAYREALDHPAPIVLEDDYGWLRDAAEADDDHRAAFWKRLRDAKPRDPDIPHYREALLAALPPGIENLHIAPRIAGAGSLGQPRFVALADYRGGPVAAEIKGRMPSSWAPSGAIDCAPALVNGRYRSPDPRLTYHPDHVVRRIAPNSRKLDFDDIHKKLKTRLIGVMARELAAVHAASDHVKGIKADLQSRGKHWLATTAGEVADWTADEHHHYRSAA